MAISTMYPAMPGSPKTTLAADLTAAATSMTLSDASVLPAAPNLAVIGDDETAEVVSYTAINGNTVSGLVRALGGTTASAWTTGASVARNFTSFDHNRFKENIEDLSQNKLDSVSWGDIGGDLDDQTDLANALSGKQATLTFDDNPTSGSDNPVKSGGLYNAFAKEILYYSSQTVSTGTNSVIIRIPSSGYDSKISSNTVVLECFLNNPSAVTGNLSWTSYDDGHISISGTCTSATTANVTLGTKGN